MISGGIGLRAARRVAKLCAANCFGCRALMDDIASRQGDAERTANMSLPKRGGFGSMRSRAQLIDAQECGAHLAA
jgi:hypothetical protein